MRNIRRLWKRLMFALYAVLLAASSKGALGEDVDSVQVSLDFAEGLSSVATFCGQECVLEVLRDAFHTTRVWQANADEACDKWPGVGCNSSGHVDTLDLAYAKIYGTIPIELGSLLNLRVLNLETNDLKGSIPTQLGQLTQLTVMKLHRNRLKGTIPSELMNLELLDELTLSGNKLSGTLPPAIGRLTNLRTLFLSENSLSGTLPSSIGLLTKLEFLYAHSMELGGSIPPEIASLVNLKRLSLENNVLDGRIPIVLEVLPLEQYHCDLGDNDFECPIVIEGPCSKSRGRALTKMYGCDV